MAAVDSTFESSVNADDGRRGICAWANVQYFAVRIVAAIAAQCARIGIIGDSAPENQERCAGVFRISVQA